MASTGNSTTKRPSGIVSAKLDDRKRVAVPAKMYDAFKAVADDFAGGPVAEPLEVVVGIDDQLSLAIFPKAAHEALLAEMAQRPATASNRKIQRYVTGFLEEMQLDKANRFRIPEPLLRAARIESEVLIIGQPDRLVIEAAATAIEELAKDMAGRDELLEKADEAAFERRLHEGGGA